MLAIPEPEVRLLLDLCEGQSRVLPKIPRGSLVGILGIPFAMMAKCLRVQRSFGWNLFARVGDVSAKEVVRPLLQFLL